MAKHVEKLRFNISESIMQELNTKEKMKNFTPRFSTEVEIFNKGEQWFNNGFNLEEAPDELKNNRVFINGFKRAERLVIIEKHLYELGIKYYNDGLNIENWPVTHRENPIVLRGFEDAKNNSRKK